MKLKVAVLLTALVCGGIALSQTTLGNMFQLGRVTTANQPASSTTIQGALLYNLDAGAPVFNDGTTWKQLIDTSTLPATPAQYWEDAGAGYIFADESASNPDAGAFYMTSRGNATGGNVKPAVIINSTSSYVGGNITGSIEFRGATALGDGLFGTIYASQTTSSGMGIGLNLVGGGVVSGGITFASDSTSTPGIAATLLGNWAPNRTLTFSQTTGNNAILLTTGARADLGGGGSDYFASDGTGITTPTYVQSSLAFASGAGILAPGIRPSGGAANTFTVAAASNGGGGVLAFDSTNKVMMVQKDINGYAPIAQPHLVYDRQTFSTRIFGVTKNMYPEIAERISCDSVGGTGATMQMYWLGATSSTTTFSSNTRRGIGLVSTDNAPVYGTTVCSSAATTQYLPVAGYNSAFCQVIETSSSIATMTIMALMSNYVPANGATTLTSQAYGFKYSSGIGTPWYACYYDGAETCTTTGVTVAVSTSYVLCAKDNAQASTDFFINGVHVHRAAGAANLSNGAPLIWVDLSAGAPNGILASVMQTETE